MSLLRALCPTGVIGPTEHSLGGVLRQSHRPFGCGLRAGRIVLVAGHHRGHGGLYAGSARGRIDSDRLRQALASVPLPRAVDGRLVLAADSCRRLRRHGLRIRGHHHGTGIAPLRHGQPRDPATPRPETRAGVPCRYAAVVTTDRGDCPDQINTILTFPEHTSYAYRAEVWKQVTDDLRVRMIRLLTRARDIGVACPGRTAVSHRVLSTYGRRLADQPEGDRPVLIELTGTPPGPSDEQRCTASGVISGCRPRRALRSSR